jgi:hypothetical protein
MSSLSSSNLSKLRGKLPIALLSLAAAALIAAGCGGSISSTNPATSNVAGASFVIGTDAPMSAVTSFAVVVESVDAVTASGTSVPLVSGTPTVDFARYNGLQSLMDMNDVPVGTYTNVQITLGAATLSYLNTGSGAPTIVSEPATYSTSTPTYTFNATLASPLNVTQTGAPVGLRVDLDLFKSILTSNGAVTGVVTPAFNVTAVTNSDANGDSYIDEFDAAVVSVNTTAQSFVVQGPHGRQFTIDVTGNTEWDNSESIGSLTTSSIVCVSGELDKADATIDADEVAILSQNGFYADGQVTYVTPATGAATSFDLYVRGLLPTTTSLSLGEIATVDVSANTNYFIYKLHNTFQQFLFSDSSMLPGQAVTIGGPASGVSGSTATPTRVSLRHWGFNGTVTANTINSSAGTFQMQVTGFAGLLVPQTVTVYTSSITTYRNGFTALSGVTGNVRVVGLLVKDPLSGGTVLIARYVDLLN